MKERERMNGREKGMINTWKWNKERNQEKKKGERKKERKRVLIHNVERKREIRNEWMKEKLMPRSEKKK